MIKKTATDQAISIFMCGDVMTGRGIAGASRVDALWLKEVLNREASRLAAGVDINPDGTLTMGWNG